MKYTISQLSIFGSSICNLSCGYCYLNKNKGYAEFNKIIQQAWLDGTYVENIIKVFEKLNSDPDELKNIELWGGEPLILTKNMVPHIADLFKHFKKVQRVLVPTNWAAVNVPDFVDFLHEIDKYVRPQNGKKFDFAIQCSIDGPPGDFNANGHNANWAIYVQNLEELKKLLDERPLKNMIASYIVHPTASKELLLKHFSTYDGIKDYLNKLGSFIEYCKDITNTPGTSVFTIDPMAAPLIAVPAETSTEEGIEIARIYRMFEHVVNNELKVPKGEHGYHYVAHFFTVGDLTKSNPECAEAGDFAVTIIPDGTIVECACSYIEHYEPYLQSLLENGDDFAYRTAKIRNFNFFNPLTATEEEWKEHFWYVLDGGFRCTSSIYYNLQMALMQELALSKQIDSCYLNDAEKLFDDLTLAQSIFTCTRENLKDTRIPYLMDVNQGRRWFNGFVDFVSDNNKAELKDYMKGQYTKYYEYNALDCERPR